MRDVESEIRAFKNIPFRLDALRNVYPDIVRIDRKASDLEAAGNLVRLKKGLYVVKPRQTDSPLVLPLLANHIYGPSYVSMETALRYYGLIPEAVYTTISITTRLARIYDTEIGRFKYIHSDTDYYPIGITQEMEGGVTFLIASPEKALCDLIVFTRGLSLRYKKEMRKFLEEDLRFDIDALGDFNLGILKECASEGKKTVAINQLIKLTEDVRNF